MMAEDEITRVRNQLRHYQGNYRDACKLNEEVLIQFGEHRESAEAKIKELEARALKAEAGVEIESELERKAWEVYLRLRGHCAISDCFTDARAFLDYRDKLREGEKGKKPT